ncbi:MAG: GspE/PulE family protein [Spirochaetia bacterium]
MMERTLLRDWEPLPEGKDQYPYGFIRRTGAVLLGYNGEYCVGISSPDPGTVELLSRFHGGQAAFYLISEEEVTAYLCRFASETEELVPDQDSGRKGIFLTDEPDSSRAVNLVNGILLEAIKERASDIHFEPAGGGAAVRFRIDGILHSRGYIKETLYRRLTARIKMITALPVGHSPEPKDGRASVFINNRRMEVRVSILPTAEGGESVSLRLLEVQEDITRIEDLGFSFHIMSHLRYLASLPRGLVIFSGPTGSGKTTTLHTMIRERWNGTEKIITIEDPVEYHLPGSDQVQVDPSRGLTFDKILRSVLRHDPDVIMIGEIRDRETALLAVRAALTGQAVYTTVHASGALAVGRRLAELGVKTDDFLHVYAGSVSQRLVRRTCSRCARHGLPGPEDLRILSALGAGVETVLYPSGCEVCRGLGFSGRTVLGELALPGGTGPVLAGPGLKEDAAGKIRAGFTTPGETARVLLLETV